MFVSRVVFVCVCSCCRCYRHVVFPSVVVVVVVVCRVVCFLFGSVVRVVL